MIVLDKTIVEISHEPILSYLVEKEEKLFLGKLEDGVFQNTGEEVRGTEVGTFCYTEEELFFPLKKRFPKLDEIELDTKILRTLYPDLDFEGYSFDPIGQGLNIDGCSRISGRLYKFEETA